MDLRLDTAPAVVSAPLLPQSAAEVFGGPQDCVSRGGTGGDGLPRLRGLAGRDDSVGAAIRDSIVALAVIGAACGHRADAFANRDLAEQIGQDRCIPNVAPCDLPFRQICVANRLPGRGRLGTPVFPRRSRGGARDRCTAWGGATMLTGVPLALALDARAVDQQMQRALRSTVRDVDVQACPSARHPSSSRDRTRLTASRGS